MMGNSSGRSVFRRYELMISILIKVFSVTPRFMQRFIWSFFDCYEGRLSVGVRYCLLANSVKKCGKNVFIGRGVIFKNIENLSLGDNISIHAGCYIDAFGGVNIGDNVSIAHQSSLVSFEHTWADASLPIKYNKTISSGINISSDVWIGCGVRVLDGSQIGQRVIVAAGAVVKGFLDAGCIYGGVPAKKLKNIIA